MGAWMMSKKGKPYYRCAGCACMIYVNSETSLNAVLEWQREILGNKDRFNMVLMRRVNEIKNQSKNDVERTINDTVGQLNVQNA